MKKILLTLATFLYCLPALLGQGYVTVVADPKLAATLVANHAVTMGALKPMADATESIRDDQEDIATRALVVRKLRDMLYKSLSEVSELISEGENLRAARELVEEIAEYQAEIAGYAEGNPALSAIAIEAGSALAARSAALMGYVFESALAKGDGNLINSRQRMGIIRNVIRELRSIRAVAFEISRRMKTASLAHAAGAAHGFNLPYPEQDRALVKDILHNF